MDNFNKYFGKYEAFETESKAAAGRLLSADNMVGDVYDLVDEMEDSTHRCWLVNRFDQRIGFFDSEFSRQISLCKANGLICKAVLSFVAFTDHPNEGHYWGETAVICFKPAYADAFEVFIENVAKRMGEGVRTRVEFDSEGIDHIIESDGEWIPSQTVPMPKIVEAKGTAVMKKRRRLMDKMIEQGRAGNKGCYFASWAFLLIIVALIVYFIIS